jgi:hypothetical protein
MFLKDAYMVLHGYVEKHKKCDYIWGGGGRFHNVWDDGQPNGSFQKKNLIKTFVLWDTSKLINMIIISI